MVAVAVMFILANYFHQDDHPIIENSLYYTDIFFIVVSPLAIVFSAILVFRHGTTGHHSVAWILFLAGSIVWYVADMTYYYDAEYATQNNGSYLVDFFYYLSYFLYLGFMISYLKPRRKAISKKLILIGAIISISFIIPSMYFISQKPATDNSETAINLVYPFLDSMVFVPAFVALVLFFRGEVNFLWVTVTLGIICMAVADTTFLVERCLEMYSASSIANMFFAWKWVLFIFGAYSHIKIFGATKNSLV
jgi:hypothetical protein